MPLYDVASFVCDARINVSAGNREHMLAHYMDKRFGDDAAARRAFTDAFAIACVQRNAKLPVFSSALLNATANRPIWPICRALSAI